MTINNADPRLGKPATEIPENGDEQSKSFAQEPIAVVGMACRLPGHSNSPNDFWEFLERGGIAATDAPESRFNLRTHHDGSKRPKTMRSPGGMFIEDIDPRDFDAGFFGVSRTDATAMDPQQRQLLEVVYECLENAGITMECLDGARIGCLVGSYAVGRFVQSAISDSHS
jgi:acyl transferase domain-containing protein